MDDLIVKAFDAVMKSAPLTGAIILILYLTRKEIFAMLTAGGRDKDVEKLMGQQVEMFRQNLVYFEKVSVHTNIMQMALVEIRDGVHDLIAVQQGLKEEVIRQGRN